jgi:hypothetical protein
MSTTRCPAVWHRFCSNLGSPLLVLDVLITLGDPPYIFTSTEGDTPMAALPITTPTNRVIRGQLMIYVPPQRQKSRSWFPSVDNLFLLVVGSILVCWSVPVAFRHLRDDLPMALLVLGAAVGWIFTMRWRLRQDREHFLRPVVAVERSRPGNYLLSGYGAG